MISVHEFERTVIACALREQNANTIEVIEKLQPEHFELGLMSDFWSTIKSLHKGDEPIDLVSLATKHQDQYQAIQDLARMEGFSPISIKAYAKKVRQAANLRSAAFEMQNALDAIKNCNDSVTISDVAESVKRSFESITIETDGRRPRSGLEIMQDYSDRIEARFNGDDKESLIKFGINSLDEFLGGLNSTDLVTLGGCSGMGKTELLITLTNAMVLTGNAVLNFTMEMDESQIVDRSIGSMSGLSTSLVREPSKFNQEQWGKVSNAIGELNNDLYWVHDEPSISLSSICRHARELKNKQPNLKLIIVDYAQIMELPSNLSVNEGLATISGGLKNLAKELRCPVILLSQLNEKEIKRRLDKRPVNGDIHGSASIANDSDRIFMVYRDEVYNAEKSLMQGIAEILITKNRHGKTGVIYQEWKNGHFVDVNQERIAQIVVNNEAEKRDKRGLM